ncbi:hypothetical protein [Haloechinothrix halophila]|uniref:hypothetical protein n=1 Tax=Haloechinothrix halophila TaxID=1069073 RepID=UPI000554FB76|nr:hypothetical protein [Haloechinothrix halophila]
MIRGAGAVGIAVGLAGRGPERLVRRGEAALGPGGGQRGRPGQRPQRLPCEVCLDAWPEEVRFFRDALRSPRATARRLRDEAAARRRAQQTTTDGGDRA